MNTSIVFGEVPRLKRSRSLKARACLLMYPLSFFCSIRLRAKACDDSRALEPIAHASGKVKPQDEWARPGRGSSSIWRDSGVAGRSLPRESEFLGCLSTQDVNGPTSHQEMRRK
jgi:hypothetical protein